MKMERRKRESSRMSIMARRTRILMSNFTLLGASFIYYFIFTEFLLKISIINSMNLKFVLAWTITVITDSDNTYPVFLKVFFRITHRLLYHSLYFSTVLPLIVNFVISKPVCDMPFVCNSWAFKMICEFSEKSQFDGSRMVIFEG